MSPALPVSLRELIAALNDASSWTRFHYFDRITGEIETALTEEVDGTGTFSDVRANQARFVPITALPRWLRLQVRQQFVQQVDEAATRLDLDEALKSAKAIAGFERLLRLHPHLQDAFLEFRDRALQEAARAWLSHHKVRAALSP